MRASRGKRVTDFDRRPVLYFHTSSADKWLQARILAAEAGLILTQFRAQLEPYDEDYSLPSEEMLRVALMQAVARVGRGGLVFVEDTTVRIDALSTHGDDVPGLRTKEWFAETSFEELDEVLRRAGNRRVTVRSDIALHVPGLERTVYFRGTTSGRVVDAPPEIRTHEIYRWLSTATFNGWFVPDGADKSLGEMQFEESRRFDFRDKALSALFDRIVEYAAALNLPPSGYRRRRPFETSTTEESRPTLPLDFPAPTPPRGGMPAQLLVIGRTCAGKTTFATHALGSFGVRHIEASDALKRIPHGLSDLPDSTDKSAYAFALLQRVGMDAVVQQILHEEGEELQSQPFVVSGLRTIEEVAAFRRVLPRTQVIYVRAPLNMRYERYILRHRDDDRRDISRDRFNALDHDQDKFGLLPVGRDVADLVLDNRGTLSEYLQRVDRLLKRVVVEGEPLRVAEAAASDSGEPGRGRTTRLSRALMRLHEEGPLTLKQLEERERLGDHNASRILGFAPNTTRRETADDGREYWTVTEAGYAYLSVLAGAAADFEETDDAGDLFDEMS